MRVLSFLLICVALAPIPAHSQAIVETFVGRPGPGFRDGVGTQARFNSASGVWADTENVYIADSGNKVIRKLSIATGEVSTFVGTPQRSGSFEFGPGALWGDGASLYVTDAYSIRKVDLASRTVSLVADGYSPLPLGRPHPVFEITGNATNTGSLQFDVLDLDGQRVASSNAVTLASSGRLSLFIDEIPGLTNLPVDFRGVLRITADVPVSVAGLRGQNNERGEFLISTTPAFADDSPTSAIEAILPHIASGAGYTTEFLLLSRVVRTNGTLDFFSRAGSSMPLPIQR